MIKANNKFNIGDLVYVSGLSDETKKRYKVECMYVRVYDDYVPKTKTQNKMKNLIIKETMSSLQIAEIAGKRHADVLRDIRNLIKKGVSEVYFTETYYTDAKWETRPMYNVSIDGLSILNQHYGNKKLGEICGQKVLVHATRFEVSFGNILIPILDELGLDIEKQLVVGDYRIDFYIPKLKVAIEYDEEQHNNPQSIFADKTREEYLKRVLGCKFIRVSYENSDAVNTGKVLNKIVKIK